MDVSGTIPWMESVESSLEQRPRATHACMDAGGTIPGMDSVESSRDAYTDVGGKKRLEQVFEQALEGAKAEDRTSAALLPRPRH